MQFEVSLGKMLYLLFFCLNMAAIVNNIHIWHQQPRITLQYAEFWNISQLICVWMDVVACFSNQNKATVTGHIKVDLNSDVIFDIVNLENIWAHLNTVFFYPD